MAVQESERVCLLQELHSLFGKIIIPLISRPLMGMQNYFHSHLDFGCGKGWWTYYAAARVPEAKFIGYDADPRKIRAANCGIPRLNNLAFTDKKKEALTYGLPFTSVGSSFVFH
ncbi:hypothetical protein A3K73_07045 [Candidatus Pacearchaeota archaeon RBG_13_36_9]|nr:MAG: hypothetical protein A3K73_07045 [Candidatus Pacearchaeota archaeon RBG_13_36_9]